MPDIVVCYKWVRDEQDIKVNAQQELNTTDAKFKISDYDKNALEAGLVLQEKHGGTVRAFSYGTGELKGSLKDVLSRGADSATWIAHEGAAKADAMVAARVIAAAIRQHALPDIILCGDGSSDICSQQFAACLSTLLEIPCVGSVEALDWDGKILAQRQLRHCVESVSVQGPAVVSVLPSINQPRIPGLKQILAAGKKPMNALTVDDLNVSAVPRCKELSVKGASTQRKSIVFKDSSAEVNVAELVKTLKAEGVLS